ncbi:alpha-amylase family glycosyl hydrolase [Geomonas azotofigens]|uniref:alpha-amylase family glycosyl hydrolase n=1 Tax=Geomonas azotofigens TaxID=2843196 RepID=UPI001C103EF9|nr:alpha-amylase family glycosyl hydrolase [Geomonas azotofigens]MBU5614372.1 alpha-amylase [Geomonas azotofigens]
MKQRFINSDYFPFQIQISAACGDRIALRDILEELGDVPGIIYARRVATKLNKQLSPHETAIMPGLLHLYSILSRVYRYVMGQYCAKQQPGVIAALMAQAGYPDFGGDAVATLQRFMELFPSQRMVLGNDTPLAFLAGDDDDRTRRQALSAELLLMLLNGENRALDQFRRLFDATPLAESSPYLKVTSELDRRLAQAPPFEPMGISLPELLRAPIKASPDSLAGQIAYIRAHWAAILPPELLTELVTALDIVSQEGRAFFGGPGEPKVLRFGRGARGGDEYPEYERFSQDADWMANVVMIAKMVYVWLGQLAKTYQTEVRTLDQIPDAELDRLARYGFSALWLIGIWERSPSSQQIKRIAGNQEAISSAYSLYDYVIANDLGGEWALDNLRQRCAARGIRLASDMVPNHTGLYSKWTVEHPDWFIQLDYPPYPDYQFNGPDLSPDGRIGLFIEDGYWDKRDAAVVFKHLDRDNGRVRYIYHGNDGTSTPWNDTAQLNYLIPQVREAVIGTILHVARQFPIIRFDAAMTLAKKHYQRLWYPLPGHGSGVPSRAEYGMDRASFDEVFPTEFWREVVDRVAAEAPDTLLLAEAFWLMEGYFVRTLGMHRVYNSAFMNMLKMEENAKYRQTVKNVLEFEPEILKRFVNFMNNPDERTAVEQFGKEGKYFGATVLLVTMPGLPMFGHGQIEGFHEKYGMEYRRAYWDEPVDPHLVARHESDIFPLMRRRHIFSGSEQFTLYDFYAGHSVNENVFAYSNRNDGERGLILFHNAFASTAGWIRTSCAVLRKNASGGTTLAQTTLGDALGFKGDGRHYYSFRDYASGLCYLRNGRDLCDKGIYVEMGAYEYHAFLDFHEIYDDDYGTWGTLCHRLNGAGVENLDEEVKKVRYGALHESFRLFLSKAAVVLQEPDVLSRTRVEPLEPLLASFYKALAPQAPEKAQRALLGVFGTELPRALQSVGEGGLLPAEWLVFTAFFALHKAGGLKESESAQLFEELGLVHPLVQVLQGLPPADPEQVVDLPPRAFGKLLGLLLRHEAFLTDCRAIGATRCSAALFSDPAAAKFLLLHESDGAQWFNKERFELLVDWLAQVEPYGAPSTEVKAAKGRELSAEAVARLMKESAAAAGYRLDQLMNVLQTGF